MSTRFVRAFLLTASIAVPTDASATDGTLLTGYGSKASGMGGAAIALPQEAIAAANNPAGMAEIGSRLDADVQAFNLHSSSTLEDVPHRGSNFVAFPEIGYNHQLARELTLGFSTVGNGGGFRYDDALFPTTGSGRSDSLFLSVAVLPTVTYKPTARLAIGASLAGGFQMFRIRNFAGAPGHGWDSAVGSGFRIGVLWRPNGFVAVGATYASEVRFGRFKGYAKDILATTGGKVDTPAQVGLGVALTPRTGLTIAADYLHIGWRNTQYRPLFGYRDQDVWRAGVSGRIADRLTLRAGGSVARQPFSRDFVSQNILLTGFNAKAATVGATFALGDGQEVSISAENDFGGRYVGTGPSTGSSIKSSFQVLSLGWGKRF